MISKELEFRGINSDHLKMYIEELGGKVLTDHHPITFLGEQWTIEILREDEIAFTSVFKVNTVQMRFTANSEAELADLIKKYRYKTTRVGG